MKDKLLQLYDKDTVTSYHTLLELETITTESDELYKYFDIILNMLESDKSFVRVRGFRLICALSKYDKDNKINSNIELILSELDDIKGTSVRQCLSKLNLILLYKLELKDKIYYKLNNLDLSKYKDTLRPLIEKDISKLLEE